MLQGLLLGLRDPTTPVRAGAAASMRQLVVQDNARELILPQLQNIVQEYFAIMNEVESESVVSALSSIVETFTAEVVPMAEPMVLNLVQVFQSYASATNANGEPDEDAAFSASQVH